MSDQPITTIAELAALAGVARSTVSRALAGNPGIALATRQVIARIAEHDGFQINQAARNLPLKRTQAIGVTLPLGHESQEQLPDPFFMSLLGPLADAAALSSASPARGVRAG